MPYCHNCGNSISENDLFCGECGVSFSEPAAKDVGKVPKSPLQHGFIFTNIRALSIKLDVSVDTIESAFRSFCSSKEEVGIAYQIVDVSNYKPKLRENGRIGSVVVLTPVDSWQKHFRLLTDCYVYYAEQGKAAEFLFIIGGDDIVPMPKIKHYFEGKSPIHSDMLYTYFYGTETQSLLESGELFHYSPKLLAGRFPLAQDAKYEHLISYLQRVVDADHNGFEINKVYGQSDPHWKRTSAAVVSELYENGLFREYSLKSSEEWVDYCYKSMLLTPSCGLEMTVQLFNNEANLYYFNMHGSNVPQDGAFSGEVYYRKRHFIPGISPEFWSLCTSNYIVVTEACHGGRFIGDNYAESMLLSAFKNKALLYVGASHVAYGASDPQGANGCVGMSCADIMARYFILLFFKGYNAAVALYLARGAVLNNRSEPNPYDYVTAVEFNLFGDPTLSYRGAYSSHAKGSVRHTLKPIIPKETKIYAQAKKVYTNSSSADSILDMVRQVVNQNIFEIQEMIKEHLYEYYKISPRQLNHIYEQPGKNGTSFLYEYEIDERSQAIVVLDAEKKISKVIMTK